MKARLAASLRVLSYLALVWQASCARSDDPGSDGQSHWLVACTADETCSEGLACHCGRCTTTCQRFDECGEVNTCYEASQFCGEAVAGVGLCTRACVDDDDCPSGLQCAEQRCVVHIGETNTSEPGNGPSPSSLGSAGDAAPPAGSDAGLPPPDPCQNGFVVQLPSAAIAERLANALFLTSADDAFLQRVEAAKLETGGAVECFVRELLTEPRARPGVQEFYRQWLELDQLASPDPAIFPDFTEDTLEALREEALLFTTSVTLDEAGSLRSLLTSQFGFANESSAPIYDVAVTGSDLQRIDLSGSGRFGVFGQAFFLSTRSTPTRTSPALRGLTLAGGLLCTPVPAPPDPVDLSIFEGEVTGSLREMYEQHSSEPVCSSCHSLFDPMGFAFESFDPIGRFRSDDQGFAIDASGTLTLDGQTLSFSGPEQLMNGLAKSPTAQSCFARHWLEYFLGRDLSAEERPQADAVAAAAQVAEDLQLDHVISQSIASEVFLSP